MISNIMINGTSEEIVNEIITEMILNLSNELQVSIVISDEYRQELLKKSNSKYGCRGLESTIREDAMKGYVQILQTKILDGNEIYIYRSGDVSIRAEPDWEREEL